MPARLRNIAKRWLFGRYDASCNDSVFGAFVAFNIGLDFVQVQIIEKISDHIMKLAIVSPQFPFSGRVPLVPPILEYLAALTYRESPGTDVQLFDANQLELTPENISADTVAISVMTATAPWAYRFADDCKRIGKKVILGGIHPTALPVEASLHADSVVVGEAESVWGKVLTDLRNGDLNNFYYGDRLALHNLPKPVDGKLKGNYQFRAFFTMRGCPYRCTFCSVRRFFGDTIRYRPITDVVNEIESCAGKLWFNGDDNIWGGDVQRSTDLFNEISRGSKRHWYGFGDLKSIQGTAGARMLRAAHNSGLFSVWVGWENDEDQLCAFKAQGKQGGDRVAAVKQMQDAGIDVTLFVVLGGRQDSIDSFKRTLELSERLQVGIHPVLLTPLPGTELYEEYREHLLPGLGWESFTGVNAVFEHPDPEMSPSRREEEYHKLSNELFSFERIVNRVGRISSEGFPSSHIYSFMMQVPMKHALSKAYEEWKAGSESKVTVDEPLSAETGEAKAESNIEPVIAIANPKEIIRSYLAGNKSFLTILGAISVADILEFIYFYDSTIWDMVEIILFTSLFVAVFAGLYSNRVRWWKYFDVLIDWKKDGFARRSLLKGHSMVAGLVTLCLFWAYSCAFLH